MNITYVHLDGNNVVIGIYYFDVDVTVPEYVKILSNVDVDFGYIYDSELGVFSKPLIDDLVDDPLSNKTQLIEISIDNITNIQPDYDDGDNQYTVFKLSDSAATGLLDIENKNFRVPFVRTDTDRKAFMPASVTDGKFTITLDFESSGDWIVNTELINSELPFPMFSIAEHRFKVI